MTTVQQVVAFNTYDAEDDPTEMLSDELNLRVEHGSWFDSYEIVPEPFCATHRTRAARLLGEAINARAAAWVELTAGLTGTPLPTGLTLSSDYRARVDADHYQQAMVFRGLLEARHPPTFYANEEDHHSYTPLSALAWTLSRAGRWLRGESHSDACFLDLRNDDEHAEPARLLATLSRPDTELANIWLAVVGFRY